MSNEVSPAGAAELPPQTPVIVGVGQVSERIGEPGYRALSAADLAAAAVRAAAADTGGDAEAVLAALDTVVAIRAFDDSSAFARAALGAPDNVARAVAGRVGARPGRATLGPTGGQGPQQLLTELCGTIADGKSDAAVLFGAEAISTVRSLAGRPAAERPDFGEHTEGSLEDRGYGIEGMTPAQAVLHQMVEPLVSYSVLENARRARLGASRSEYARAMGALFSRFSAVAARNPHAAAPVERTAAELIEESDRNRRVTDVYTRLLIAREQVNQSAAVVITSLAAARRLGIPAERTVFLAGHADLTERELLARPDLSRSPAAVAAVRCALDMAGVTVEDLAAMDLYSCFPIAVFNICDGLGLDPEDPRGLTVTGGLPYFGGPGNNYSTHGIAEIVARVRDRPGSHGMVVANGGILSKHSVGIYTTTPAAWRPARTATVQAELNDAPEVPVAVHADGWGTLESYVVKFDRDGSPVGIVLGRLDDGRRFLANTLEGDSALIDALTGDDQAIGGRVFVRSTDAGNRVAVDRERMDERLGHAVPTLRDNYSHVRVTRSEHILEVTIDRPQAGNALNAEAQRELDEIFGAFQHDDDLWVAVLSGAGDEAFCVGHDLDELASPMQLLGLPRSGFGGLVARELTKPVIAAVDGRADGGGLELVLACQLVVADDAASFALPDTGFGQSPGPGVLVRLPRTVGRALAHDMIVTGRRIDAAEAVAAGLVARVAPTGKAVDVAREMAADIVARSPVAIRAALAFMARADRDTDPDGLLGRPADLLDKLIPHRDPVEGLAARREGREPRWRRG
ncbi:acetyl-CoA C-acetyltransferase [Nocardia transvalensis]|uniref:Acetyl-CoA C-acetyltransferase n=1 Tax=Nocardia transvalensis TaxID=37333 RepID=A0A7W9PIF0_9NOCA|nr:acetyl-CoA acetyltransferase [Nocardia transvalensis]MBB5916169.1 acetyl-CoA C-acetyltransferase [Nocardia transvalensis]